MQTSKPTVMSINTNDADDHIFKIAGRRVVFFPLGPFLGYVLPRTTFRRPLRKVVNRLFVASTVFSFVTTAIGSLLGATIVVMIVTGVLDFIAYRLVLRRVTRRLTPLPFQLSFRIYARMHESEKLAKQFIASLVLLVMGDFAVLHMGDHGFLMVFGGLVCTAYAATLIWVHRHETSRESHGIDF